LLKRTDFDGKGGRREAIAISDWHMPRQENGADGELRSTHTSLKKNSGAPTALKCHRVSIAFHFLQIAELLTFMVLQRERTEGVNGRILQRGLLPTS